MRWLPALILLLAFPAVAAPTPLQRTDVMMRSTTAEAKGLEAPLAAVVDSARAVAESGGARDPVLLLHRDADIIDQRADALDRKAQHLSAAVDDLCGPLID